MCIYYEPPVIIKWNMIISESIAIFYIYNIHIPKERLSNVAIARIWWVMLLSIDIINSTITVLQLFIYEMEHTTVRCSSSHYLEDSARSSRLYRSLSSNCVGIYTLPAGVLHHHNPRSVILAISIKMLGVFDTVIVTIVTSSTTNKLYVLLSTRRVCTRPDGHAFGKLLLLHISLLSYQWSSWSWSHWYVYEKPNSLDYRLAG